MSNGKNGDFQSKYEKNSAWAERIALLIIIGLATEIAAVFILEKTALEAALTIAGDVLIVLGVWGELFFAKRAREAGDSIVAEANARAKEAELEIAKLKAPRQLTSEEVDGIAAALKPLGGFPYDLSVPTLLEPGSTLINGLVLALNKAGWELRSMQGNVEALPIDSSISEMASVFSVLPPPGPPGSSETLRAPRLILGKNSDVMGVLILADPTGHPELFPPAMALKDALTKVGMVTQCFAAHTRNNMAADVIHISIGAKP
jgi:hypothetical protein